MSRPHCLRCVFANSSRPLLPASPPHTRSILQNFPKRQHLHSSPTHRSRPSPKFPNVKASTLGLSAPNNATTTPANITSKSTVAVLPRYTPKELQTMKQTMSSAQFAALEAGEAAISPDDLLEQGAIRSDPMAIKYLDDFTEIRAVIDDPVRAPESNYDPNLRFKDDDEIADDLAGWVDSLEPDDPDPMKSFAEFEKRTRLTVGKPEAELDPRSYEAPEIPELTDSMTRSAVKNAAAGADGNDGASDPHMQRLMKQTGLRFEQIRRLRLKILNVHRVVNQTRMGKVQSMYYLTVAGNGNGMVGIGEGKSTEPEDAQRQSAANAIRNMVPVVRYEERTIFGFVTGKVGATELQLMTRPPGFGIRCQHLIYEICKCAGISDLAARVTRARNPMNTVKATMQALLSQRLPEEVARARGKKLVDVRKVYYGGLV
ncbi:28S ribosomal protein S5, mitochondrial [Xylographa bjoerkii]|nr:28S ribosomal protein S5, mitochondrial [Xylographa bjoerkii]